MAPEQARGQDADYRADIYGLGALAYRVLTGRPPVSGKDTPSLLHAVVYATPTPPSELTPGITANVDAVIARAMAKNRGDRFDSVSQFADALRDVLR